MVWTKVYQQYFFIRSLKRLRKMELAQQFYNHQTLLALNKPVPVTKMVEEYQEPVYEVYPPDVPPAPAPGPMPVPVPDPSLAVCSHVYVNEVLSIKCVLCSQPYFRNVVFRGFFTYNWFLLFVPNHSHCFYLHIWTNMFRGNLYWFICSMVKDALYGRPQALEAEHERRGAGGVVRVDTVRRPEFRPNYFFGDTFGVLPCRQCSRWSDT